ncbi:HAMP domain-containing protein [Natranaerovirga hydrolytica]|uniref:histidine kinase n=1 Tax=Natranaerovirga hydrolytica TaxID=680378 RepID=A0A4R1N0H8_9FIRM|nr:HAMP domain-containing sensor histidine kinase [Natranaerovirga hydrolytica]TCK98410.1 HAMP domain-containing protein [Natranaerovirga hydrolytica]
MLLTYIIVGIIPLVILISALLGSVERHLLDQKTNHLQRQVNILTSQLTATNYIRSEVRRSDLIEYEINQLGEEIKGRVLIVNSNLMVIKDTNQVEEGRTIISEDVVRGLSGDSYIRRLDDNERIQAIAPVKDNDTQDNIGVVIVTASVLDVYETISELRNISIIIFIITVFVILILSYYFSEVLTRPFKELLKYIKEITDGHFEEHITVKGHQEIEEISEAFNEMTNRLQETEQSRQEFVSNVSHELKTPLTSIKVLADTLLSQEGAPVEMYVEFLEDIRNEIDREDKIINDLLSLVKLNKKEVELNIDKININILIEQILRRLQPLAKKDNIELIFETHREVVAQIDEVKLTLGLTNIIENAIKYNLENGRVKISLDADHKFFYVKIVDSGVGIPKESIDKIFNRFYRVDKARSRETGGTGLGLAIAKNSILMHKGFINVKSKEGEGTTFTLRIPLYN